MTHRDFPGNGAKSRFTEASPANGNRAGADGKYPALRPLHLCEIMPGALQRRRIAEIACLADTLAVVRDPFYVQFFG